MRRSVVAAAGLLLAGCYTVSYQTKLPGGGGYQDQRGDYFLWGLVGEQVVQLKQLCPGGVSRWRSQQTFVDGLLYFVTLGIYAPRHVTVECTGGSSHAVRLDAAGERALASLAAPAEGGTP